MSIEKKIDNILSVSGKIKFEEPNPFLYTRILEQIEFQKTQSIFSNSIVRFAITGLAILSALNLFVLFGGNSEQQVEERAYSFDVFVTGNE